MKAWLLMNFKYFCPNSHFLHWVLMMLIMLMLLLLSCGAQSCQNYRNSCWNMAIKSDHLIGLTMVSLAGIVLIMYWPIYIDWNPTAFGTFCTKSLGVSGFRLSDCLLPSKKNVWDSPVRSSTSVYLSSFLVRKLKSLISRSPPLPYSAREFSRVMQKNMKIQKVDLHLLFCVSYDPNSLCMAKLKWF